MMSKHAHEPDYSDTEMSQPASVPSRTINLLIMGETGVGKSTFINNFVNCLTFESLDEALEAEGILSLIASSFTISDDDFVARKITTKGRDGDNEVHGIGQSATQFTQVYRFEFDDIVIRIIDTPGIGDVRGIEKDKENFENIMRTIGNIDVLHGILILLKPNNSRLDVMFRFCISELLVHLHKSAAENIIFGFTNSRGTFYKPGDTLPVLKNLLDQNKSVTIPLTKENVFCFDSESFRFLAAVKQGVTFSNHEVKDFRRSWQRSAAETHRLFCRLQNVTPHKIRETTSLNGARTQIVKLTKPLAEITRLIDMNIKLAEDKIDELSNTEKKGRELNKALMVQKIDLEPRQLGYPRTVCTNSACIDVVDWEGTKKVNYKTHCHEHCFLKGVQVDTVNTAALLQCAAMNGQPTCQRCSHGYQEHMHVLYELLPVTKTVEDKGIRDQIRKNATDAEKKQAAIESHKRLIEEYRKEHKLVEKAAAEFGCFLKHNAILPYSDARLEYMDHLIKEERAKAQASGDDAVLQSLLESKQMYQEEMKSIENAIKIGQGLHVLDPDNVKAVYDRLTGLKHFAGTLANIRDAGVTAHKTHYKEHKFMAQKCSSFLRKAFDFPAKVFSVPFAAISKNFKGLFN